MKTNSELYNKFKVDLDGLKKRINPDFHFGDKQTVYFVDLWDLINEVEYLRGQVAGEDNEFKHWQRG